MADSLAELLSLYMIGLCVNISASAGALPRDLLDKRKPQRVQWASRRLTAAAAT
jgi:hypothetical protein